MGGNLTAVSILLILLILVAACVDDTCPAGTMAVGERCLAVEDGGAGDATSGGDAAPPSDTGPGPDACLPMAEECNGVDDDCDGMVDEGFGGVPEACNGLDDDCDGAVDEGLQGLVGAPIPLVVRGAAEGPVAMVEVGGQLVAAWTTWDSHVVWALLDPEDGSEVSAPSPVEPASSDAQAAPALALVDDSAVVVVWREESAPDAVLRARLLDPGSGPVGAPVEVTANVARLGVAWVTALDGLVAILWRTSFGSLEGRTYDTGLGGPTEARTLFAAAPDLRVAAVETPSPHLMVAYLAPGSGGGVDQAHLARVTLRPLAPQAPTIVGGGTTAAGGVQIARVLGSAAPEVAVAVSYVEAPRVDVWVFAPGDVGAPIVPGPPATLDLASATNPVDVVALGARGAVVDMLGSTLTGPSVAPVWASAEAGTPGGAAAMGSVTFIGGAAVARVSSRRGAILYAATPLASTPPSDLILQRVGCE